MFGDGIATVLRGRCSSKRRSATAGRVSNGTRVLAVLPEGTAPRRSPPRHAQSATRVPRIDEGALGSFGQTLGLAHYAREQVGVRPEGEDFAADRRVELALG